MHGTIILLPGLHVGLIFLVLRTPFRHVLPYEEQHRPCVKCEDVFDGYGELSLCHAGTDIPEAVPNAY